ncbi:glycosyltransferase family 2 protein [Candidatus Roizmanbacteria bacterium]|nr:glycosyltransferase family 2 protein [Candidatus Roizmanbacteria bacterium]
MQLSLALATHNEEANIEACITSCKGLVDEVIVVDGSSTDKTAELAHKLGARVLITSNPSMFHINKQKAIDAATGEWILQLDADERVSPELAEEIKKVIKMSEGELEAYEKNLPEKELFERHENIVISSQNGGLSHHLPCQGSYNAFFIPRLNFFLGKYLRYGGVYPDGVIRLFKKGKAHLPCKDVHEIMEVEGRVGWLQNPLRHIDSPTFKRYLERNSRYITLMAEELRNCHPDRSGGISNIRLFFDYMFLKPFSWFFMTTFRHKGILDGWQGVVFSFFSALRFPRAYWRSTRRS